MFVTAVAFLVCIAIGAVPPWHRRLLVGFGVLLVLGLQNAVYYLHWYDRFAWYYELRSWAISDHLPALSGLLVGYLARHQRGLSGAARLVVVGFLGVAAVFVPLSKALVYPLDVTRMGDTWNGEVCLQSSPSSCGPACLATVLRRHGMPANEREIAIACRTTDTGTELWYLARHARAQGLHAEFQIRDQLPDPVAIIGTTRGGRGHFQAVLAIRDDQVQIGDPMQGARWLPRAEAAARLGFSGMCLVVSRPSDGG